MTLSEYIKSLQKYEKMYGEVEVIYSKDDEGNGFDFIKFPPSLGIYDSEDKEFIFIDEEEINPLESICEEVNAICVN